MRQSKRLKELYTYQILDTPQEKELDDFAELAALSCNTPFALISFIDRDRHWYKAKVGLEINQYKIRHPFVEHILKGNYDFIEVKSLTEDKHFNKPLALGKQNIEYYAGVTLKSPNGYVLGTLSVLHEHSYCLNKDQKKSLKIIGDKVMKFLNDRRSLFDQQNTIAENAQKLKNLTDHVPHLIFQLRFSPSSNKLQIEFVSRGIKKLFPMVKDPEKFIEKPEWFIKLIHPEHREKFKIHLKELLDSKKRQVIEYRLNHCENKWHLLKVNPEVHPDGSVTWYGNIEDITSHLEYEKAMENIVYDLSHVLRRPVANLLGINNLLQEEKNLSEKDLRRYSKFIQKASQELDDYSRELNEIYQKKREEVMMTKLNKKLLQ